MEALLVLAALVIYAATGFRYGRDSRIWDDRDRRRWWPGTAR
jgi:hypothetical protein